MMAFDNLNTYIARQRLARAVARDIDQVFAACVPDDWLDAAPAEPSPCLHPLSLLVVNMLTQRVRCRGCESTLTSEEITVRLEQNQREE